MKHRTAAQYLAAALARPRTERERRYREETDRAFDAMAKRLDARPSV